ncbi:hypothetical protein QAD02_001044 [Eretmocerus hayati]|uniref:Uncharacterized protein n=1 Tax=Eretmocerus hayati TaxID=131215 RepID=A0ACC2NF50_9HYME|nr:hypothetical protein QAD02_001044 [Eretmocerus hayati]
MADVSCDPEDPKKEFPSKKELKEYQIIYTLPLRKVSPTELDWLVEVSIFTLMGIAKWSTLFNTTYNFDEVGKLMNDDVAVFAGAYIFKIFMSINSRCTTIRFAGPYTDDNAEDKPNLPEDLSERFQLCYSLRSLGFLTTTGCVPNVQNFFTYCNRHVIYAIGPIKKGETLVASIVSFFDGHSKAQRQASYQNSYSRSCDCRACKENWSDILGDERSFKIWLIDPSEEGGIEGKNFSINNLADRLQISYSLRSYGFLTTTRCIPNVHSFITYGNRHVMYALNPIKKGTPLIASAASIEYGTTDLQRQSMYGNINHQLCDCQACSEDWAKILADRDILEASVLAKSEIGAEILEELNQIHEEMEAKSHRINHPDTKLLSKAQSLVAKTWKHFPMPSMITVKAIRMMEGLLARFHTPGNQDERRKNFFSSQTFKDYMAIYNLPFPEAEGLALSAFMGCSVIAMVGLAQHSKLFKTTYKSNDYGKLMNDDFAVFAAAFMIMGSVASIYHKAPKNARQTLNAMRTDIKSTISPCHCQACSEDWDEILKNDEIFLVRL